MSSEPRTVKRELQGVRVIGHPHSPSGMGEHCRSVALSLAAAGFAVDVVDVFGHWPPHEQFLREMARMSGLPSPSKRSDRLATVLAVNCDELEVVTSRMGHMLAGQIIVYPAWELPHLPQAWGALLNQFGKVWASSEYSQRSFSEACLGPVELVGLSVRSGELSRFHSRSEFGLPDDAFCVLNSFHMASYASRKNPLAAVRAIAEAREALGCGGVNVRCVLKLGGTERFADEARQLVEAARTEDPAIIVIGKDLSEEESRGLVLACDAVMSLHRAEGFGLSLAEAFRLGRPVIATAYSGNMDFCSEENSWGVPFELTAVPVGAYPYAEGQYWAEPSTEAACEALVQMVTGPSDVADRVLRARFTAATQLSHFSVGSRMRSSIEANNAQVA